MVDAASAQWIVYDPSNYAQNVLTAAARWQINNQITSLQNEAQMLINQAVTSRACRSPRFSACSSPIQNRTQQLLGQAQNIAFDVQQIDQAFQIQIRQCRRCRRRTSSSSPRQDPLAEHGRRLQDAMRHRRPASSATSTPTATQMSALVGSQGATGALQATQAGNQLLALQAQQLADLTAVVAANGRRRRSNRRNRAAAEQGREQRRRFLTPGTGYQPGNAQMFYGGN